jgi:AraC family transcriptional regulator of adaptative response/methylated-DNA-[protein]-cysteine methyltransferase
MHVMPAPNEMYQALLNRDGSYEGLFVVAVKTTGIFCRPTCPARKPHLENVEFFPQPREALLAGYRPCKRCRPMDAHGRPPQWVQRVLDEVDRAPAARFTDAHLRDMGAEPSRVRRYFKDHYGMTFHAYHRARRMGLALSAIRAGEDLTQVGMAHGYESLSGFRDAFTRTFGAPPGNGASLNVLYARWLDTPLGPMLAVANDDALYLLEFCDRRAIETQIDILRRRTGCSIVPGDCEPLHSISAELNRYFAGELQAFETPLEMPGSPFQQAVWRQLCAIPYGRTSSYAQMASDVGRERAARAIGRANGENRLAIIVPCHRVVRRDGSLCGYGGGMWRKQWLLDLERAHAGLDDATSLFDDGARVS